MNRLLLAFLLPLAACSNQRTFYMIKGCTVVHKIDADNFEVNDGDVYFYNNSFWESSDVGLFSSRDFDYITSGGR
jgi:hypothetical protein